jgi:hypothetical protein
MFKLGDKDFALLNDKIEERAFPGNRLYLCANNRLVDSRDLEKYVVDLDGQIYDLNGFWYVGILTSQFLDAQVDMNRLSFSIPESCGRLDDGISIEKIVKNSCAYIENYLKYF